MRWVFATLLKKVSQYPLTTQVQPLHDKAKKVGWSSGGMTSVAEPDPFDTDPDPAFQFDTDPNPAFQSDTDPDLTV
jgi:hypothetical protein